MTEKKPYYISTAIAYTSAKPHIGNTYEIVLADAIARYKRQAGYDVYFQTGTDEHGLLPCCMGEPSFYSPDESVGETANYGEQAQKHTIEHRETPGQVNDTRQNEKALNNHGQDGDRENVG